VNTLLIEPLSTKENSMRAAKNELTLNNAFSDPLVRTLMAADKVDPASLQNMLADIAGQITPSLSPAISSSPLTRLARAVDSMCGCSA
jgi:hypothetical protein